MEVWVNGEKQLRFVTSREVLGYGWKRTISLGTELTPQLRPGEAIVREVGGRVHIVKTGE